MSSAETLPTRRGGRTYRLMVGQIRQLSELHEEGILTDEEFIAKEQELLSRL
jgi:hypothetical protein